jgi:hypothetical protein
MISLISIWFTLQVAHSVIADPADPTITSPARLLPRQDELAWIGYNWDTDLNTCQ